MVNVLKLNDIAYRKFTILILTLLMIFWGSVGLSIIGLEIPLIRELSGLIILLFTPGFLILRILKLHDMGNLETLLYAIGLSITTIMFLGFLINLLLPLLGNHNPISFIPLITIINVSIFILMIIGYFRDKEYVNEYNVDFKPILSAKVLAISLIIFIAIFSALFINLGIYNQNIPKLILIIAISLIFILTAFNNYMDQRLYPYILFASAFSLLLSTSLVSNNLSGYDSQGELYFSSLVLKNSLWNYTLYSDINSMISIVILAPILSIVTKINLTWIFKIIYPLIFSMISLGIYKIVKIQTNSKIAFISAFFFISLATFYTELVFIAREQIAELFLILMILLLVENKLPQLKKTVLFLIFTFSLVVSHYGLSYLYLIILGAFGLVVFLGNTRLGTFIPGLSNKKTPLRQEDINKIVTLNFVLLFFTFVFAWYLYVSNSSPLDTVLNIGKHISGSIFSDFLDPNSVQALGIIVAGKNTLLRQIFKLIYYVIPLIIIFGVLFSAFKSNFYKIKKEYKILAIANLFLLFLSLTIPGFSNSLNATRIYQVAMIVLSMFFVIGFLELLKQLKLRNIISINYINSIRFVSIFCLIFFLFSSGFVYELANDQPSLITLNNKIDYPIFSDGDIQGAEWLSKNKVNKPVYADIYRALLFDRFEYGQALKINIINNRSFDVTKNSYIYLGSYNTKNNKIFVNNYQNSTIKRDYIDFQSLILNRNEIYNNGGFSVYN
jgi:uncharacterized membrane protein